MKAMIMTGPQICVEMSIYLRWVYPFMLNAYFILLKPKYGFHTDYQALACDSLISTLQTLTASHMFCSTQSTTHTPRACSPPGCASPRQFYALQCVSCCPCCCRFCLQCCVVCVVSSLAGPSVVGPRALCRGGEAEGSRQRVHTTPSIHALC